MSRPYTSSIVKAGFAALALMTTMPHSAAANGRFDDEQPGGCSIVVVDKEISLAIGARPENSVAFNCLELNNADALRDAFNAALNNSAPAPKGDGNSHYITYNNKYGFRLVSGEPGQHSTPISSEHKDAAEYLIPVMTAAVRLSYGQREETLKPH